jgi:hypothetical protein
VNEQLRAIDRRLSGHRYQMLLEHGDERKPCELGILWLLYARVLGRNTRPQDSCCSFDEDTRYHTVKLYFQVDYVACSLARYAERLLRTPYDLSLSSLPRDSTTKDSRSRYSAMSLPSAKQTK